MLQLDLKGFDDLLKAIDDLKESVGQKVLQDIANKVAKDIIVDDLKRSVPTNESSTKKSKNQLANNIRIIKQTQGVRVGFDKRKSYYVKWLEKGTRNRQLKGKGKYRSGVNRGRIGARPFIRPSFERSVPRVIDYLNNNIAQIAKRALTRRLKML